MTGGRAGARGCQDESVAPDDDDDDEDDDDDSAGTGARARAGMAGR